MREVGISLSPIKSNFGPLLFSGNLDKGLSMAKQLGYSGVELSLLDSGKIDQDNLIRRLDELGLCVYTIATGQTYYEDGYSLYAFDDSLRQNAVERMKGHINLAARLNCKVIIGGIRGKLDDCSSAGELQNDKGKEAIISCVDYGKQRGVILLLEPVNRYETNIINTVKEGLDLIAEIGRSNLKLLPDTFHMNIEEKSFKESLIKAGDHIGYIHFADSNRLAPGWGHVDFYEVLSALDEAGYNGPIGVEILPKPGDLQASSQAIGYIRQVEKTLL